MRLAAKITVTILTVITTHKSCGNVNSTKHLTYAQAYGVTRTVTRRGTNGYINYDVVQRTCQQRWCIASFFEDEVREGANCR